MGDGDGKSGVIGLIAGVAVGAVIAGMAVYWVLRPDPLKPAMTTQQVEEAKAVETKGERALLEDLEKKLGPNHPQVQQMKLELGITPPASIDQ